MLSWLLLKKLSANPWILTIARDPTTRIAHGLEHATLVVLLEDLSTTALSKRWLVERVFAWLMRSRRIVIRYEQQAENLLGFVHLACVTILLRRF